MGSAVGTSSVGGAEGQGREDCVVCLEWDTAVVVAEQGKDVACWVFVPSGACLDDGRDLVRWGRGVPLPEEMAVCAVHLGGVEEHSGRPAVSVG